MIYDIADFSTDPLTMMLRRESEDSDECFGDEAESIYFAGTARAKTCEVERVDDGNMLGASPFELREYELTH